MFPECANSLNSSQIVLEAKYRDLFLYGCWKNICYQYGAQSPILEKDVFF